MSINLEKIDLLKERANVSYSEAKIALENVGGDIVEALIYLEKNEKIKKESVKKQVSSYDFNGNFKNFINTFKNSDFIIRKKNKVYVNLPLVIALVIGILSVPISIFLLMFAFVVGCKLEVKKSEVSKDKNENLSENTTDRVSLEKKEG